MASKSRFQLQLKQKQRKNHERKIQDPPWGEFPTYILLTPKMNLSLYSPQASLESHVKGSSHCKKLLNQGNLCQNFILTSEEFNREQVYSKGTRIPSKMNLSLLSPQDELEIRLRVTPTVKSHRIQTELLKKNILTFEEIN